MILECDGKNYKLPVHWCDITLGELLGSRELVKEMPKKLHSITYGGKDKEIKESEELDVLAFQEKWIRYWTKLPKGKIAMADIQWCYATLVKFLGTAKEEEINIQEIIVHNKKKYALPTTEHLTSGDKYMSASVYAEYVEGAQLSKRLNQLKEGDISALPLLTATFYRPKTRKGIEPYDEESVIKRAEEFMSLPMDKVWGAYFFLSEHLEALVNGSLIYSKEAVKRANTAGITLLKTSPSAESLTHRN